MPDISVSPIYNEIQLIIACARTSPDAEAIKRIDQLLDNSVDWQRLIELSIDHNVVPLVYSNLHRYSNERVPSMVLAQMHDHVQKSVRHNLVLTGELLRLLNLFAAHCIEAIPYKGPVLAAEVYGTIGLRETGDLDIFIHKRDFARAKQVMLSAGYHPDDTTTCMSDASYIRTHNDYPFVHKESGVEVELQWGVMQVPFIMPTHLEDWWADMTLIPLMGREIPSMRPESLLLILCIHGAKHVWSRLAWICDIAEVLHKHPHLDWNKIVEQSRRSGCERMLLWGVLLARDLFAVKLPIEITMRTEQDLVAKALASEVHDHLYDQDDVDALSHNETPFFYLRMMDRFRDRLRLCIYCYRSLGRPRELWQSYGFQPLRHLFGG